MGKFFYIMFAVLIISMQCKDDKPKEDLDTLATTNPVTISIKKTTKTYLNAWSNNDTVLLQEITISNLVRDVNGDILSTNHTGLFNTIRFWHRALPDLKIVEKEIVIVGNRAYVNWTAIGTNTGMFEDIPPTGKKAHIDGFSILTFDDMGLIVHETTFSDLLGLMTDWGYTLSPPIME